MIMWIELFTWDMNYYYYTNNHVDAGRLMQRAHDIGWWYY